MKHINKIFLICLLVFTGIIIINASSVIGADTTAPEILEFNLKDSAFSLPTYGSNVSVTADLKLVETETGITKVVLIMQSVGSTNYTDDTLYFSKTFESPVFSGTMNNVILESNTSAIADEYKLSYLQIYDTIGNSRIYYGVFNENGETFSQNTISNSETKKCKLTHSSITFTNTSCTAPQISSLNIMADKIENENTQIPFSMTLTSANNIKDITVYATHIITNGLAVENYEFTAKLLGSQLIINGNSISGNLNFVKSTNATFPQKEYYINRIVIVDNNNSYRTYRCNISNGYFIESGNKYIIESDNSSKCYITGKDYISYIPNDNEGFSNLKTVTFRKDTVIKPGVAYIQFEFEEEMYLSELSFVLISSVGGADSNLYGFAFPRTKSNKFEVSIPISSEKPSGMYYLGSLSIKNEEEKSKYYPLSYSDNYLLYILDEMDVAFQLSIDNPELITRVTNLKDHEVGQIILSDKNKTATSELFSAINGRDVTIIFQKTNYQWIFNGLDIIDDNIKNIDLNINFTPYTLSTEKTSYTSLKIEFADNGLLPGKAQIKIKSDHLYTVNLLSGKVYLYYINEKNNNLDYEENADSNYYLDGTDHWCQFELSHNSSYLLTGKKLKKEELTISKVKKITLSAISKKIAYGKKIKLTATVQPSYLSKTPIIWTSSNSKYASVDKNGYVKTLKAGINKTVTITATANDGSKVYATYKIKILKDKVKKISAIKAPKSIKVGKSISLKTKVTSTGKTANTKILWTSSNSKFAKINKNGIVTALKKGKGKTVKITAQSTDGTNKKVTIQLKIK